MKTKTKLMIILMRQESVLESWMRDASTFTVIVALISLGIALDSPAMEWLGAILAFIAILARSSDFHKQHTFTLDGAQAELDRLKAEQVKVDHANQLAEAITTSVAKAIEGPKTYL